MDPRRALAILAACSAMACQGTHLFLGEQAKDGDEDGDADADADGDTDTGETGDLQPDPDLGGDETDTGGMSCERLDLLLVIQNTADNQLVANIEPFTDAIAGAVASRFDDFHIGIVRTHDSTGTCRQLGALSGDPSGAGDCQATNGGYASHEDADISATLQCLVDISTGDQPMDSPSVALATARGFSGDVAGDPGWDAAQTCNAGFVRDDALHALIIAGRRDDEASMGEPADWADWMRPREDEGGLVITSVLPLSQADCMGPTADRLSAWLDMHPEHSAHDACKLDLFAPLAAFIGQLDVACP